MDRPLCRVPGDPLTPGRAAAPASPVDSARHAPAPFLSTELRAPTRHPRVFTATGLAVIHGTPVIARARMAGPRQACAAPHPPSMGAVSWCRTAPDRGGRFLEMAGNCRPQKCPRRSPGLSVLSDAERARRVRVPLVVGGPPMGRTAQAGNSRSGQCCCIDRGAGAVRAWTRGDLRIVRPTRIRGADGGTPATLLDQDLSTRT